jgi:uncharacterized delta-60 repeat protein
LILISLEPSLNKKDFWERAFMNHTFRILAVCVSFVCLSGFVTNTAAAPGDLDTSFSFDGKLIDVLLGASGDRGSATAVQADGKIVVAGTLTFGNSRTGCGITRYNQNGSLDLTFSDDGKTFGIIDTTFSCRALVIQPDGKILVAGGVGTSGAVADFAVMRFNADGTTDHSFSTLGDGYLGYTRTHINGYESANAIALQPDGKIVVAGANNNGGSNFAVVRYHDNGNLDDTFDFDGKVTTDFASTDEIADAVAIQTDGKIVVAGYIGGLFSGDFALARYNPNGSLDTTFDGDGKLTTDMGGAGNLDRVYGLAIQADGRIVAAGYAAVTVNQSTSPQFALARYNADGTLDTSFDEDGKVTTAASTDFNSVAYAASIQADGKILATGYSHNSGTWSDFTLVRYNANGSLDASFDGDGIVMTDYLFSNERAQAAAIQADGKIVAAGFKGEGGSSYDFALIRYNADGSLDTSFDTDGRVITDVGYPNASKARKLAIQADGKVVVAGETSNGFNTDFALIRYHADGTRDASFGIGGKVLTDISSNINGDTANALAIQADGRIVAAGQTTLSASSDFALVRYNADGSLDTSFDGDGKVTTDFAASSYDFANAVAIQADGKIIAVGVSATGGNFDFAIARYNANGSLDTSFDGDGKVTTSLSDSSDNAYALVIQPDGKIVVAGSQTNGSLDFALARYNADGSLDASFDGDGKVSIDITGTNDGATSVVLQADGRIVATGSAAVLNQGYNQLDFALVRYNANGSLDASFDGDGKVTTDILGRDSATGAAIQPNGKIVVAGYSFIGQDNDGTLARYNTNGSLDATFGTGGKRTYDFYYGTNNSIYGMALDSNNRIVVAGETAENILVARILADSPRAAAPFDFDGDGKTDLSIFRPAAGEWWINKSSNGGNAAFAFGNSSDKLAPADFTGDGKTDIAVWRGATGEWFVLRSEDTSYYSFPFGTSGDTPVPADFDADGKTDAAVFRPSNSTWYINKSTGGVIIQQFGQAGDAPVTADYDADGRSDIAIWRAATGEWWINRSTAGIVAYTFGNSSDKPVQGDYTGDGKADVAFFRPVSSEWYVLRSENQSYYSFAFGTSGDTPAPGDYDADGKFDATVFRPSTATWYSQRTTAGTLIQAFGQTGDRPVPNVFVP